jgi:sterol carrier protein 2
LASEKYVREHKLEGQAVEIMSMVMQTDRTSAFGNLFDSEGKMQSLDRNSVSFQQVAGTGMTQAAAKRAFSQAGVSPRDIRVVELHDCFSANELITLDALGLTSNAISLVQSFSVKPNSKLVVARPQPDQELVINPSGGLISKGHPLGATGLAQCAELTWQLRGWCGKRQVLDRGNTPLRYALQHNIGNVFDFFAPLFRPLTSFCLF